MFGRRGIRNHIKSTFNLSQWIVKDALVGGYKRIQDLYKQVRGQRGQVLIPGESFDQACERLKLTQAALNQKMRYYKNTSALYGLFFLFSLCYWLMLVFKGLWVTVFMATAYCFLLFTFFFRESFWYMQIKKRKLGMSFTDWLKFMTFRLS